MRMAVDSMVMNMLDQIHALSLPDADRISFLDAIDIYQAFRPIMPSAISVCPQKKDRLVDIIPEIDALVLDGYGVINVGSGPIDGIDELFAVAASHDVPIIVLTNGASFDTAKTWTKYDGWGLPITPEQIVSSRDAMLAHICPSDDVSGAYANLGSFSATSLPIGVDGERRPDQDDDFYEQTEHFVFLGSVDWAESDQQRLETAFLDGDRQLHIANPDVVSPHEHALNAEPGYWAARLIQRTGTVPKWYGKPHAPAFRQALDRLQLLYGRNIVPSRVAMVGDSLHTDIIGAGAMGMRSVLLTDYGLFRDGGAMMAIDQCAIYPDWIVSKL